MQFQNENKTGSVMNNRNNKVTKLVLTIKK